MSNQSAISRYTTSGLADVLALFGIPANTAMQLYQDVLGQRAQEGMDILNEVLADIRQGNFDKLDQHEIVSVCARYQRDAMEGVAKNNLYLLARTIKGMAEEGRLEAPSFNKYANILASLTEEEIKVLGVMARFRDEKDKQAEDDDPRHDALLQVTENPEACLQALMRTGLITMRNHYFDDAGPGTFKYLINPLMHEILHYTDFIIEHELSESWKSL